VNFTQQRTLDNEAYSDKSTQVPGKEISTVFQKLRTWIKPLKPRVIVLYGFGSYFKGETHHQSDIDLGVLFERPLSSLERFKMQETIARQCLKNVDLVDLRKTSTVMAIQIIFDGKIIYCRDEKTKDEFETFTYSSYALLNEERREILNDILQRGSVHG